MKNADNLPSSMISGSLIAVTGRGHTGPAQPAEKQVEITLAHVVVVPLDLRVLTIRVVLVDAAA